MLKILTCQYPLTEEGRAALDAIGVGTLRTGETTFTCYYNGQTPQAIEDAARGVTADAGSDETVLAGEAGGDTDVPTEDPVDVSSVDDDESITVEDEGVEEDLEQQDDEVEDDPDEE